jgi:ADP-ribose diphosphatase
MAIKPETVFRTPWFEIATIDGRFDPNGGDEPYYALVRHNGVIGFILDEAGRIILVQQFRPPLKRDTLEMPAGAIEPGETPPQAMARELREETGFVCAALYQAAPCRVMLNREDVIEHFFVGLGARRQKPTGNENIHIRVTERSELLDMIATQKFEQTVALGGVYVVDKAYGVDLLTASPQEIEEKLRASLRPA